MSHEHCPKCNTDFKGREVLACSCGWQKDHADMNREEAMLESTRDQAWASLRQRQKEIELIGLGQPHVLDLDLIQQVFAAVAGELKYRDHQITKEDT